jgi:hypothetical protein
MASTARRAGLLYLLMGLPAPFNLMYMPRTFIVPRDAAATMHNIAESQMIYRLTVLAGLVSAIGFVFLVLTLYELFKDVDRRQARFMVGLVLVSATIGIVTTALEFAPLIMLNAADSLSAFSKPQLDALGFGFLRLRNATVNVNTMLWGLWLMPFGILVLRSGFIPKLFGWFLLLGCAAYVTASLTAILAPAYLGRVTTITLPLAAPGELCMMFWLLFGSGRVRLPNPQPSFAS